jgi:hypothetical protein
MPSLSRNLAANNRHSCGTSEGNASAVSCVNFLRHYLTSSLFELYKF